MSIEIINFMSDIGGSSWADVMDNEFPEDMYCDDQVGLIIRDEPILNLSDPTSNKIQDNKVRQNGPKPVHIGTPGKVVPVPSTATLRDAPPCDEECLIPPMPTHQDGVFDETRTNAKTTGEVHQTQRREVEDEVEVVVESVWESVVMTQLVLCLRHHIGMGLNIYQARLNACEDVLAWAYQVLQFCFDDDAIHAIQHQIRCPYLQAHYKVQLLLCYEKQKNHNSVAKNGSRKVSRPCCCGEHGGALHCGLGCLWEMVGLCNGCREFHHNCLLKSWDKMVEGRYASQLDVMCKVFMGLSTFEARTEAIRRLLGWQSGKVENVSKYISSNLNVKRGVRQVR